VTYGQEAKLKTIQRGKQNKSGSAAKNTEYEDEKTHKISKT